MIPQSDLRRLMACAARSDHPRYRHAAAIFSKHGEMICMAPNQMTFHAEINALRKYLKAHRPRGREIGYMVVIRLTNSGKALAKSDPCIRCRPVLDKLGIPVFASPW